MQVPDRRSRLPIRSMLERTLKIHHGETVTLVLHRDKKVKYYCCRAHLADRPGQKNIQVKV